MLPLYPQDLFNLQQKVCTFWPLSPIIFAEICGISQRLPIYQLILFNKIAIVFHVVILTGVMLKDFANTEMDVVKFYLYRETVIALLVIQVKAEMF